MPVNHGVDLYIYDLSQGIAKALAPILLSMFCSKVVFSFQMIIILKKKITSKIFIKLKHNIQETNFFIK